MQPDGSRELANVRAGGRAAAHVRIDQGYADVSRLLGLQDGVDVDAVVAGGAPMLDRIRAALEDGSAVQVEPFERCELGPALARPGKIMCLGRNYYDHAVEMGGTPPAPEIFVRVQDSLAGPYDDIELAAGSCRFDYGGELGVVIGKDARAVPAEQAMACVAGYVVTNDFSARDWQRAANQWTPGKNFDRSCPVGPDLVTADEVGPSLDLALQTSVNGEIRQSARTSQMMIDVARAIEFLSSFTALRGGDLILTGTPGGVGDARRPPLYLAVGDEVEVSVETIGVLRNRIVAAQVAAGHSPLAPACS